MTRYRYEALDPAGTRAGGFLDATDARAAAIHLRDRSMLVLRIREARPQRQRPRKLRRLRARDQALFFREMAIMTRSGVTLLDALEACERRSIDPRVTALASTLAERIRTGRSLSAAMAASAGLFDPLFVRLVESAEATGELDPVLDRMADTVERREELRRTLATSLAYPCVVVVVAIGVAVLLVVGVVPKFSEFFARQGMALPPATRLLLGISTFARTYGWHLLALLFVGGAGIARLYGSARGRIAIDRALLRVPLLGSVLRASIYAQFSWVLGTLLQSGVGLIDSLRLTGSTLGNRAVAQRIDSAADGVLRGRSLSEGLECPSVPAVVTGLVAAGEQSGALPRVLSELTRHFRRDLQLRVRRLAALVEPALILVVGGMVALVYMAFFQAVLQLAQR